MTTQQSLDRDAHPDSYCQGWDTYFKGGVGSTSDTEVDTGLFRDGWEDAKFEDYVNGRYEQLDALERSTWR